MPLTQIQIIRALGDAMSWFEREQNWGVPATELRHLNGRIGELYAALITNGQMAPDVNQPGYDVVAESGERISVKTTCIKHGAGHISFNGNTLTNVDRVIVLRINTDEMQIETLLDKPISEAEKLMTAPDSQGKRIISLSKLTNTKLVKTDIPSIATAHYGAYTVTALENGTINVFVKEKHVPVAKPILRKIAAELGVGLLNANNNPYNTRQLGSLVIAAMENRSQPTG
ncbi:hypothetical protein SAMN06265222_11298 [Neorhodopirellula lusitana]|uniref:DUF6998 domain-containing protein n=1 Tax=Neorhodopirellula lusitana TaxID=445327 RepID=A0ABY1QJK5_9BACT|nr:hypothetical protein [Neorhodopirellula lusitana]SMP69732.1 hypothetical protein SAMN06265222_11298 [Neorhodopirellula lusitana]